MDSGQLKKELPVRRACQFAGCSEWKARPVGRSCAWLLKELDWKVRPICNRHGRCDRVEDIRAGATPCDVLRHERPYSAVREGATARICANGRDSLFGLRRCKQYLSTARKAPSMDRSCPRRLTISGRCDARTVPAAEY